METTSWSNIPSELLPRIAERLGIIELLSFRGVCKEWNSASSTASASIQSSPNHAPWILLYGDDNSQCRLLSKWRQVYTIDIPEFSGATCLASIQGWPLLQNGSRVFFFCPFSHAKIILPEFKQSGLSDHIAAFSSQPTSQECIVFINSRDEESKMVLNVIKRRDNEWNEFKYEDPRQQRFLRKIVGAIYCNEVLYLFDNTEKFVITFTPGENKWNFFFTRERSLSSRESFPLPIHTDRVERKNIKDFTGFGNDILLSTCGTILQTNEYEEMIIVNESESESDDEEESEKKRVKGVWIYLRFFQVPPNQSWSL